MSIPARIMERESVNQNQIIRERSGKRGAALMLLWLLAETHGQEAPPIPEIAEIINVSERHVKRLIEQCEQDGDIKVTRGQGRGHHSIYNVTYLLKGDAAPFQKSTRTNKTQEIKGDIKGDASPNIKGDITSNVTPFPSEIKGDIAQPPHTPHKDNIKYTQEPSALRAPRRGVLNSEGLDVQRYVGRLLKWRKEDLKTIALGNEKGEAGAAKWMHGKGYTTLEVWGCYRFLTTDESQKWRNTPVTLITVKSSIADWKKGNLNAKTSGNNRAGASASQERDIANAEGADELERQLRESASQAVRGGYNGDHKALS